MQEIVWTGGSCYGCPFFFENEELNWEHCKLSEYLDIRLGLGFPKNCPFKEPGVGIIVRRKAEEQERE